MADLNTQLLPILTNPVVLPILLVWTSFWKGLGLWISARKKHLVWFVLILLFNTLGLLEIAYVFYLKKWDLGSKKVVIALEKQLQTFKKK